MENELNIYQKLTAIQNEIKVPKGQNNDFGGYKYRSAEDIQEKAKPLLQKYGVALFASDSIEMIGNRFYVKATVTFTDGQKEIIVTALAREPEEVKKQAEAQTTGSSSSYARKYALAGLFQLDDTKDPDATNKHEDEKIEAVRGANVRPQATKPQAVKPKPEKTVPVDLTPVDAAKIATIKQLFNSLPEKTQLMTLDAYGIEAIEELPRTDWERAIDGLNKFLHKK